MPVAAGVTRGMRAMAVPLAYVLLLAWGGCLLTTLRHETRAIHEVERVTQIGEARMCAEIMGMPFP